MERRRTIQTIAGAAAVALAMSAAGSSSEPAAQFKTTRARSSLLRILRMETRAVQPQPAADQPQASAHRLVQLQPIVAPLDPVDRPQSDTARDSVPTNTITFRRTDGTTARAVVYDDIRHDPATDATPAGVSDNQSHQRPNLPPGDPQGPLAGAALYPPGPGEQALKPRTPQIDDADLPPLPSFSPDPPEPLIPAQPQPATEPLAPEPMQATEFPQQLIGTLPSDFTPWWSSLVMTPLRDSIGTLPVAVDTMVCQALTHSPHVLALQSEPEIRRTQIVQEQARFDWKTFLETRYDDISDPVGNTLTTGGPNRLENQKWNMTGGLRRQTALGGELEASQQLGWEASNSTFFQPSPQRTARLQLSYTQPLLHGAGQAYNESRIVLARINTNTTLDQVGGELQDHLLKVARTYWELYRARAVYLQRLQFLDSAEQILETLDARQEIDSLRQQILRAKAAVASRRTSLVRAGADIRNAESRLKLLVNHPALLDSDEWELIPSELPGIDYIPLDRCDSFNVAMMHRPDISRATREIRAAGVRLGVAENELLPRLDLILSSYLYGLDGQNIPQAYGGQYDTGRPSFAAGLKFEMPLGNRAALAREDQRQWELSRAMHEYRAVVQSGMTDVDVALREVETSHLEMVARWEAMAAAHQETAYLKERWLWLGGSDRAAAGLLEELMLAQQRLADEEEAFVTDQVRYVVSLSEARRAMGTLMQCVPGDRNIPAMPTRTAIPSMPAPLGESPTPLPLPVPVNGHPGETPELLPTPPDPPRSAAEAI